MVERKRGREKFHEICNSCPQDFCQGIFCLCGELCFESSPTDFIAKFLLYFFSNEVEKGCQTSMFKPSSSRFENEADDRFDG